MATLNITQNGEGKKGRTKALRPTVDLTAMVDLAFLLITFFMLTTSLAKMREMPVAKPVDGPEAPWPESRTMTILLGQHNQAVYYLGNPESAQMQVAPISAINKHILSNKQAVADGHTDRNAKRMLVIVKPTESSQFKDLVDVLDEMEINGIESYAISDRPLMGREIAYLRQKGL